MRLYPVELVLIRLFDWCRFLQKELKRLVRIATNKHKALQQSIRIKIKKKFTLAELLEF